MHIAEIWGLLNSFLNAFTMSIGVLKNIRGFRSFTIVASQVGSNFSFPVPNASNGIEHENWGTCKKEALKEAPDQYKIVLEDFVLQPSSFLASPPRP